MLTEYEHEPMPGLPTALPEGEFIRWQGRPQWRDLAVSALHVRKLAVYFAVLIALRVAFQLNGGMALAEIVPGASLLVVFALAALGLLALLAWLMARATCYTVTNRRLVIRSGVAVPMSVNLPFGHVVSADLRRRAGGRGDIVLTLAPGARASWVVLWPHVRHLSIGRVQPMLRALDNVQAPAAVLADALTRFAREPAAEAEARVRVRRAEPGMPAASTG